MGWQLDDVALHESHVDGVSGGAYPSQLLDAGTHDVGGEEIAPEPALPDPTLPEP